jgi:cytochrome c oxidase assembly protein subunit 15
LDGSDKGTRRDMSDTRFMSHAILDSRSRGRTIVGVWLLAMCAMVFVMVVIGGLTRLTGSGLSMVEWQPITGWLPPFGETAWRDVFAKYQAHPEYHKVNLGMTLDEFKAIFWLEYVHRLWGRIIGVAFLAPFVVFLWKGWIERSLAPRLAAVFVLGALQGVLGWYMVKSGLIDDPNVSQYRLTAHFGLAVVIYGYMLWVALGLLRPQSASAPRGLVRATWALTALIFATMLSGGFVAGLDAGFAYNTFPLMDGALVPPGLFELTPWYLNFFENIATVQFNHRMLAIAVVVGVFAFWWRVRRAGLSPGARRPVHGLALAAAIQAGLGIATLLLMVPTPLAAAHQAVAVVVFTLALWTAWELCAT